MYFGMALYGPSKTLLMNVPEILMLLALGTDPITDKYNSDLKGCGSVNNTKTSPFLGGAVFDSSAIFHCKRSTRLRAPADIENWRTQLQPIRTIGEISAHIKIFPVHQPYLYQKLSEKATQLRLLGMSYQEIARSLNINRKTATKACEYQGR